MSDIQDMKKRLAAILYEKSYLQGDFILSSGRRTDYYFDCRQSSLHPEGAWLIGALFFDMLRGMDIQAVAGMTMGADPLLTATSLRAFENGMFLPSLIVRKEAKSHGAGKSVEGLANVRENDRVLLLEDVVTTGGSVIKAAKRIEEAGLRVASVFCILNREEQGWAEAFADAGYELRSIFTRHELLSQARG